MGSVFRYHRTCLWGTELQYGAQSVMETRTSPASVHCRSCGNLIGPSICVGIATQYGSNCDALEIVNTWITLIQSWRSYHFRNVIIFSLSVTWINAVTTIEKKQERLQERWLALCCVCITESKAGEEMTINNCCNIPDNRSELVYWTFHNVKTLLLNLCIHHTIPKACMMLWNPIQDVFHFHQCSQDRIQFDCNLTYPHDEIFLFCWEWSLPGCPYCP